MSDNSLFYRRLRRLLGEHSAQLGPALTRDLGALLSSSAKPSPIAARNLPLDDDMLSQVAPEVEPDVAFEMLKQVDDLGGTLCEAIRQRLPSYVSNLRVFLRSRVLSEDMRDWLLAYACIDASDSSEVELVDATVVNIGDGTIPFTVLDGY